MWEFVLPAKNMSYQKWRSFTHMACGLLALSFADQGHQPVHWPPTESPDALHRTSFGCWWLWTPRGVGVES